MWYSTDRCHICFRIDTLVTAFVVLVPVLVVAAVIGLSMVIVTVEGTVLILVPSLIGN